jgi:hypothetical protein
MLQPRNVEPKASGTNATRKACAGGSFKGMTNGCEECDGEDAEVGARRGARAKKFISLGDWLDVGLVDVPVKGTQTVYLAEGVAMGGLPSELPCQTSVCFTNVGADWVAIYRRGANPVMIERQIGKGSIVLSSLSFPVSNEGLQEAPHPALITWLMGGRRNVVFDETHLGIVDEPGIVELLRRNGLYGFLAAFVGLALLYVWRQSVPLAPSYGEGARGDGASAVARDSLSGLASLLRQHVARDGVLGVCLAEWRKTAGKQRVEPALAQRIASVVESCSKSPAGDYNAISRMMLEEVKPYAGAKRRRKPDEPR